jgi:hypothetical protein
MARIENAMTCEEFEQTGWDAERDRSLTPEQRAAALAHLARCPRCAGLDDSWRMAKSELRALAGATEAAETPSRVEMRLRLEFRTRHQRRTRRAAVVLSWALGVAAVATLMITWIDWHKTPAPQGNTVVTPSQPQASNQDSQDASSQTLVAESNANDFTPLPGSTFSDADDASVVRVRMQRSSLGALGLPVADDRSSDWIQVDLLVTDDGLPQAIRVAN